MILFPIKILTQAAGAAMLRRINFDRRVTGAGGKIDSLLFLSDKPLTGTHDAGLPHGNRRGQ